MLIDVIQKMRVHIWSISLYLWGYLTHNKAELALKQKTPHK